MNRKLKSKIVFKYLTQEDFCQTVRERPSLVSQVIRGRRQIPLEKKIKWAVALDCRVDELFPEEKI
jgi:transcriptional regulator with XRE-family HTH domain